MKNPLLLQETPLIFFKKCEQLVQKQKKKFEMDFKQVSIKQKSQILKKTKNSEKMFVHDKTLVKPLSYNRYLSILITPRREVNGDYQPIGTSNISMIHQNQNYNSIIPPNPSDSSMMSERQTYETFFGKYENPQEKVLFHQSKLESTQKLKNIEKDYSKISNYYDEMSNIVMSQNQEILATNNILGGAVDNMHKADSEIRESYTIRQTSTTNTLRTLLMVCLMLLILGFIYVV